jgi:hypothetical protein
MKVQLYKYTGNTNTVNKRLNTPVEVDGKLYSTFDVMTPTVTLRATTPFLYNYVYIPTFKRYYFVTGYNVVSNDKVQVRLTCDVLKTYETQILQASATVTQTDNPDKYSSNRETIYNRKPNFEKIEFPNKNLFNDTGTMIMITLKGDNK